MQKKAYYCMRYYVTYRCNSRCQYCNVWWEKSFRNKKELDAEEAERLLNQGYAVGVRYIDFTGGEPTLYPDLARLLRYAKKLGIKTEVTTNGLSHSPEKLREIAACADKFNFSLDTLNRETYHKVRGVDGLESVLKTMESLMSIRRPKIMTVVSEDNMAELDSLVSYAQQHQTEIYLNPVFSYFDSTGNGETATTVHRIMSKIFEPYTVVMLHFMEFLLNAGSKYRPPCSANRQTLTIAPDGALMLPCYHASRETIPWDGNLANMLETEAFSRYAASNVQQACWDRCAVIPYFGISFNYRLDVYFLIQSYSEKLNHLKRDYLNRLPELEMDSSKLQGHLKELLEIVHSLQIFSGRNYDGFYWAEQTPRGYRTDVYRELMEEKVYWAEQQAEDCWGLKWVPHCEFDKVVDRFYRKAYACSQSDVCGEEVSSIFQDAAEFQLRLWKYYISKYMNVSVTCNFEAEEAWLKSYWDRLLCWESKGIPDCKGYAE